MCVSSMSAKVVDNRIWYSSSNYNCQKTIFRNFRNLNLLVGKEHYRIYAKTFGSVSYLQKNTMNYESHFQGITKTTYNISKTKIIQFVY